MVVGLQEIGGEDLAVLAHAASARCRRPLRGASPGRQAQRRPARTPGPSWTVPRAGQRTAGQRGLRSWGASSGWSSGCPARRPSPPTSRSGAQGHAAQRGRCAGADVILRAMSPSPERPAYPPWQALRAAAASRDGLRPTPAKTGPRRHWARPHRLPRKWAPAASFSTPTNGLGHDIEQQHRPGASTDPPERELLERLTVQLINVLAALGRPTLYAAWTAMTGTGAVGQRAKNKAPS